MINLQRIKHGGRSIEISRKYNIPLSEILDFSSNTNPLGYPKKIDELNLSEFNLGLFPDDNYANLVSTIARKYNCSDDNVLVGNGSTEIIRMIANCFISKGTKVAIPKNTYAEYSYSVKLFGGETIDFDFNTKSDIVFLCNPNNPTGAIISKDKILGFLERYSGLVVIDESYIDFLENEDAHTLTKYIDEHNIIILRSLSKFYALPGIRLGFCLANKKIIKELNSYRISWNVNSIAAKLADMALNDSEFISKSKEYIKEEKEFFYKNLREFNIRNSHTHFFLMKVNNSIELTEELEKKGILVREGSNFGLVNYIRISLRKREDNLKLIEQLTRLV